MPRLESQHHPLAQCVDLSRRFFPLPSQFLLGPRRQDLDSSYLGICRMEARPRTRNTVASATPRTETSFAGQKASPTSPIIPVSQSVRVTEVMRLLLGLKVERVKFFFCPAPSLSLFKRRFVRDSWCVKNTDPPVSTQPIVHLLDYTMLTVCGHFGRKVLT